MTSRIASEPGMAEADATDASARPQGTPRSAAQAGRRWRWPDFIQVVLDKDPAARNMLEVLLYPSVHALFFHRIAHALYRVGVPVLPRFISQTARFVTGGVEIHPGAQIGKRFFIDHGAGVVIGETSIIGDDVMLYHQVTIGATGWWRHANQPSGRNARRRHPKIENGVTIGVGASILGPITIGANTRIGALAIVTEDVPPESVVVGPRATYLVKSGQKVDQQPVHQLELSSDDITYSI